MSQQKKVTKRKPGDYTSTTTSTSSSEIDTSNVRYQGYTNPKYKGYSNEKNITPKINPNLKYDPPKTTRNPNTEINTKYNKPFKPNDNIEINPKYLTPKSDIQSNENININPKYMPTTKTPKTPKTSIQNQSDSKYKSTEQKIDIKETTSTLNADAIYNEHAIDSDYSSDENEEAKVIEEITPMGNFKKEKIDEYLQDSNEIKSNIENVFISEWKDDLTKPILFNHHMINKPFNPWSVSNKSDPRMKYVVNKVFIYIYIHAFVFYNLINKQPGGILSNINQPPNENNDEKKFDDNSDTRSTRSNGRNSGHGNGYNNRYNNGRSNWRGNGRSNGRGNGRNSRGSNYGRRGNKYSGNTRGTPY